MSSGRTKRFRFSRKASRANRLSRLRSTEPPTLRLTVIPILERPHVPGTTKAIKKWALTRIPVADNRENSERFRMRSVFLKKNRNGLITLKGIGPLQPPGSAGQPCSSLGATTAQYLPAALGGHTFTESVISGSSQSAGLKWSFHACTSCLYSIPRPRICILTAAVEGNGCPASAESEMA